MSPLREQPDSRRVRRPKGVTPERWVAWRTIARTFDESAYTDRALTAELENVDLDARQRAQARHLAFGTVRHCARLDHVIATVGKRPLAKLDAPVLHALRLGLFQVLESSGIADHAAVDQSVEIVRAAVGERAVAFANAILRRGLVDGPGMLDRLDSSDPHDAAILASVPEWMIDRMLAQHGNDGVAALAAQLDPPSQLSLRRNPLVLRTRTLDADALPRPEVPLADALPDLRTVASDAGASSLDRLLETGAIIIQSAASQLVVRLLDPQPQERIVDLCSAPGGKATDISARVGRANGSVAACEVHEHRARELQAFGERLGAGLEVHVVDATRLGRSDLAPGEAAARINAPFARALVDAPCSGLGVLTGRPDSRWRRHETDAAELAVLQLELLAAAARIVTPGGTVVYSTCTMDRIECEDVVDAAVAALPLEPLAISSDLLEMLPDDMHDAARPHELRTWPHLHATDGFFCALLRRTDGDAPDTLIAETRA